MTRAHFGHRRKIGQQVLMNQREIWWAVRDSNSQAYSIFSNLLNSHVGQFGEIGIIESRGHKLGTRRSTLASSDSRLSSAVSHQPALAVSPLNFSTADSRHGSPGLFSPLRHVADKRLPRHQKLLLSFPVSAVTVLVRRLLDSNVLLCRPFSLRKLCVALSRAKGALNENSSGTILRLRFSLPVCVYAGCHAQPCVRSRTRHRRSSPSVPPRLPSPRCTGPCSSQEVALSQGASLRGRLAH
jgi:hypothetical protein